MKRQWIEENNSSVCQKKRSEWTLAEDTLIKEMAKSGCTQDWNKIATAVSQMSSNVKSVKQCRERWHNRLNPLIKSDVWTQEEEARFFELYQSNGPKWSIIAQELPGRTDNTIKNFFFCKLRKVARRIKNGIIAEDMKSTPIEISHTKFMIDYLKTYFIPKKKKKGACDKYIMEMIKEGSLSKENVNEYLKEFTASIECKSSLCLSSKDTTSQKNLSSYLPSLKIEQYPQLNGNIPH